MSSSHVVWHAHDPKQTTHTDLGDTSIVEQFDYFGYGLAHVGFKLIVVHDVLLYLWKTAPKGRFVQGSGAVAGPSALEKGSAQAMPRI
jgi:hypothetical protein